MRSLYWIATTAAVLAGCGEVKSFDDAAVDVDASTVDGSPGDPDAAATTPDAATRGVVHVEIFTEFDPGVPQSGVTVVFLEPDGRVAARVLTDDSGKASAELTSGGSVTAVRLDTSVRLVTILGVEAGDTLLFGAPAAADQTAATTVDVGFVRTAHPSHELFTSCGVSPVVAATESRARKPMTRNCDRTPRDLVLRASGATSPTAVTQFAVLSDQTASTINVAASQWTSTVTGQAMLTAVPGEVKRINVGRMLRSDDRRLFTSITALVATQGRAAFNIPIPNAIDAGDDMIVTTELFADDLLATPHQTVRERGDVSRSHGLDVAAELLPWVSSPRLDPATRTLSWTQQGTGDIDAFVAEVVYIRGEGETQKSHRWRLIAPIATGSVVFPELPPELGDIEPRAGDRVPSHPSLYLLRHGDRTYRQLRADLDRNDTFLNADGTEVDLTTKFTLSRFTCGRGCSLPLPTLAP